jgi:hypothetical protein
MSSCASFFSAFFAASFWARSRSSGQAVLVRRAQLAFAVLQRFIELLLHGRFDFGAQRAGEQDLRPAGRA